MRSKDLEFIGAMGVILGCVFSVATLFAYSPDSWDAPYRDMAFPLGIVTVVLFVIGLLAFSQAGEVAKLEVESAPSVTKPKAEGKFFCRYCGKENKPDALYCEACGKKF